MLYKKPDNLKYTDLAIYVDGLVARGNPTKEELDTAFKYLYHLAFMLAHKHKYFNKTEYYEDFAIYLATDVLSRLFLNPKLESTDNDGEPVLTPIKSCLNYMKAILYGRKVFFEQQNYSQKFSYNSSLSSEYTFNNKIRDSLTCQLECDMDMYLRTLSRVVKHYVYKKNPYKNNPIMMKNIYISVLFSLVNSITLTEADINNIKETYSTPEAKDKYIVKIYNLNKQHSTVLYHLPNSMYNYITVLTRQVTKVVSEDIKEISSTNVAISDAVLSDIVYMELDGKLVEN